MVRPAGSSGSKTPSTLRPRSCTAPTKPRVRRGPAVAHDQACRTPRRARRAGSTHDLADPRAAVVGEVAVQLFDPGLRREDQRDRRFHRRHRAVGSPSAPHVDPVERLCGRCPAPDRARWCGRARSRRRRWRPRPAATAARVTAIVTVNGLARLADAAAAACVDREHLGVGHDDRDRAVPGEEHVDAVAGGESAADRTGRIDRDAHRPQPVTGGTRPQRPTDHELARLERWSPRDAADHVGGVVGARTTVPRSPARIGDAARRGSRRRDGLARPDLAARPRAPVRRPRAGAAPRTRGRARPRPATTITTWPREKRPRSRGRDDDATGEPGPVRGSSMLTAVAMLGSPG